MLIDLVKDSPHDALIARYRDYRLAPVPYRTVADEVQALHREHWAEVCAFEGKTAEDYLPCAAPYHEPGFVFFIAALPGEVVGYAGYFLQHSTRTSALVAMEDLFFVRREHRVGRLALALTRHAEGHLRALGVAQVVATAPLGSPAGKIWQRLGYAKTCEQFVKEL